MVSHFTVALTSATPASLASLIGASAPGNSLRFISIQAHSANAAVAYVGGRNATLSSSNYGWLIPIPVTSIPAAPSIIELGTASFSLGDIFVLGTTGDELQIMCIGG